MSNKTRGEIVSTFVVMRSDLSGSLCQDGKELISLVYDNAKMVADNCGGIVVSEIVSKKIFELRQENAKLVKRIQELDMELERTIGDREGYRENLDASKRQLKEAYAWVDNLKQETAKLKERLVKEHLPETYESWEKVWNHHTKVMDELKKAKAKCERLTSSGSSLREYLIESCKQDNFDVPEEDIL